MDSVEDGRCNSTEGGDSSSFLESGGHDDSSVGHHRHHYFSGAAVKITLLFVVVGVACLSLNQSTDYPTQLFKRSNSFSWRGGDPSTQANLSEMQHNASSLPSGNGELGLKKILKRAAMGDKTVIMTTLNEAWIEPGSIFDLFLESFRIGNQTLGLLKHLVVVALDQTALNHCLKLHLNCYLLTTEGVDFSGEAQFMTGTYLQITWKKIDLMRTVLETGYNFVFTDADIMWLRSPFPHFYTDTNFQVSCDRYGGNPSDLNNAPNSGFNYVRSSNETVEFFKFWYRSRELYPGKHDQDVLNKIKYDPFIRQILGIEIKFLDTVYFGGFCSPSRDLNLVSTMHANCCAGLDNKIHDLKILLDDWRKYMALAEDVKESQPPSWSVPQSCGPASFGHHTPRKRNGGRRK